MEVDAAVGAVGAAGAEYATILCCICSVSIQQNPANMCVNCLRNNVDITEGINRSMVIHSCRSCKRFLCPPWQNVALESKELLAACLRKIPGLNRLKVVDAVWIWTEPHSMRLKIKITVQKEVTNGAIMQQAAVVDFAIRNQQCKNCEASYAQGVWHAVVQVRQRVLHKRTFFFLEQLLLKHRAHADCINIVTFKDGMDFYFKDRQPAVRFIDFLEGHVPVKHKYARKLVSADHKDNSGDFKHNYLVEIVPICKDDLISMPKSLAKNLSDMNPMCLVKNVGAGIHITDPRTGERQEISAEKYWRQTNGSDDFLPLQSSRELVRFIVLEVEPILHEMRISAKKRGYGKKIEMAECTLARECDLGVNDDQFTQVVTHLGHILRVGDTVMGYDLTRATWAQELEGESKCRGPLPDIVLVRKDYSKQNKEGGKEREHRRAWTLKKLEVEEQLDQRNTHGEKAGQDDYEAFLRELEGDKEMRSNINLYKNVELERVKLRLARERALKEEHDAEKLNAEMDASDDEFEDEDESDDEAVKLDELLDELDIVNEEEQINIDGGARILSQQEGAEVEGINEELMSSGTGFEESNFDMDEFNFISGSSQKVSPKNKGKAKKGGKK